MKKMLRQIIIYSMIFCMTALCNTSPVSAREYEEIILSPNNSLNNSAGTVDSYGWITEDGESVNIDLTKGYKGAAYRAGSVGADAVNSGIKYYPQLSKGEYCVYVHKFTGTVWGGIGWKINGKSGTVNYGTYYGGDLEYEWIFLGSFDFGGKYMSDCVELVGTESGYSIFDAVRFVKDDAKEITVNPLNEYNDEKYGYAVVNGEYASKNVNSDKLAADVSAGYCGDAVQGINENPTKNDLTVTYYPNTDRAVYSVYTHNFKGMKNAGNVDLSINGIYMKRINVGSYCGFEDVILKADNDKNNPQNGKTVQGSGFWYAALTDEGHYESANTNGDENQKMTFYPKLNAGEYDVYMARYSGYAWGNVKWTMGGKSGTVNMGAYNDNTDEYCIKLGTINAAGNSENDSVILSGTGGNNSGHVYFTALKFVRADKSEVILKADNSRNDSADGTAEWLTNEWIGETTESGHYRSYGNGADTKENIEMKFKPVLRAGKYNVYMARYSGYAWGQIMYAMGDNSGTVNMGAYNSNTEEYCISLGSMEATGDPERDSVILSGTGGEGYAYLTALKFVKADTAESGAEWEYAGDFMFEGISGKDSITLSAAGGGYAICDSVRLIKNESYDYSTTVDYSTDSEEIKQAKLKEYNGMKSALDLRKFLTKYKYGKTTFDSMYTKLMLNKKYLSYNELQQGLNAFIERIGKTSPIKIYSADGKETSKFDGGKIVFDSSEFAVGADDEVFAAAYGKDGKLIACVKGTEAQNKYEFDFTGKNCDKNGTYKIFV